MHYPKTLLTIILFISIFFVSSPMYAFGQTLKATVQTKDTAKPVLLLTNSGSIPCKVIDSNLGTVAITKVMQNGRPIKPLPIQVKFDDGLERFLAQHIKTLQPNASVELPLDMSSYQSGTAIEAITWSKYTGPFGMIYPLQKGMDYSLEATYVSPIEITGKIPSCGTATTSIATWDFHQYLKYIYLSTAIILLLLIVYLILRSKKLPKKGKKRFSFFLLLTLLLLFPVQTASATYSIPTEDTPTFDRCMEIFDQYPEVTRQILDSIDSEQIYIFTNTDRINDAVDWPDGSYHIRWDATSEYDYPSDDGTIIPSTPCDRLFHELYHVYELQHGTDSRADCAGSGIPTDEVNATRIQNKLRKAMGLPPRQYYDNDRLPLGDCSAPAPTPPPPSPSCWSLGCGIGWGEPHLQTFDLRPYDFQAVGEFIATKDPKGDFEIQTRQQPWATSRFVSMNTAIAMRVVTDTIEVRLNNFTMELLVNGRKESLHDKKLNGGGSLSTLNGNHIVVNWPDGSNVTINFYSTFGLDMYIQPSNARKEQLVGLLGNDNGDGSDDLVMQGTNQKIAPEFDQLYPKFANSWRVTNQNSLFTYDKGRNTNSYTDTSFPDKYTIPADLPNAEIAEQICKQMGITDKTILQNCTLDVGLTGRPEFAYAAMQIQKSLSAHAVDYDGQNWNVKINRTTGSNTYTFKGKAHQKVFVDLSNTTLPNQCGILSLLDPMNNPLADGCIDQGNGFIDSQTLPVDGTYSILVHPMVGNPGSGFLQIVSVNDQIGTITPGGNPVTINISKPGIDAELSFHGEAGRKYTVDITNATLPDQCGGIGAEDENGSSIGSACLSQGSASFETIPLPTTGEYKITLNPSGRGQGKATVRITEK
ncbi:MAG TPA: VWD domain-containing protein [Candidatus Saccharimonadales bacterium]|nr:VWD domain-containing protein [Candidatus Saccharimonadales bacterium]